MENIFVKFAYRGKFNVDTIKRGGILDKRSGDAAYDIASDTTFSLEPGERKLISTGLYLEMPREDMYAQIAPRSGLAVKHGIMTMAGVIDSSYRGEVKVCLYNSSDNHFHAKVGDRIAQLIFLPIVNTKLVSVHDVDSNTERGTGGFGSTGR